jgi:hypothetical protein
MTNPSNRGPEFLAELGYKLEPIIDEGRPPLEHVAGITEWLG